MGVRYTKTHTRPTDLQYPPIRGVQDLEPLGCARISRLLPPFVFVSTLLPFPRAGDASQPHRLCSHANSSAASSSQAHQNEGERLGSANLSDTCGGVAGYLRGMEPEG